MVDLLSRVKGSRTRSALVAQGFRLGISALFFYVVSQKISWGGLLGTLRDADPFLFGISCVTLLVNPWFLAKKFRSLLWSVEGLPGLWALLRINLICLFYAIFIPTGVGVGLLRWYQMGQIGLEKIGASAVIVMERLLYLIITVLFVLLSLVFSGDMAIAAFGETLVPVSILFLAGLSVLLGWLTVPVLNRRVVNGVGRTEGAWRRFPLGFEVLRAFVSRFAGRWKDLAWAGCWGVAWQVVYCLRIYTIFLALDVPMRPMTVVWVASLILFLQILPISYLGLGVRESAYAFIFLQFGLAPEQGVSVGLLSFLQLILASLVGWFLVMKDALARRGART